MVAELSDAGEMALESLKLSELVTRLRDYELGRGPAGVILTVPEVLFERLLESARIEFAAELDAAGSAAEVVL
jgi:hypothetical protein